MNGDNKIGKIKRYGNIWCIPSTYIEEVYFINDDMGYITVLYMEKGENNEEYIQKMRLKIDKCTIISDSKGYIVPFKTLRAGMWIDTDFSSKILKTIPPQSEAYCVHIKSAQEPHIYSPLYAKQTEKEKPLPVRPKPPARNAKITIGSIVSVDLEGKSVTTGKSDKPIEQMKFNINHRTEILDKNGKPIPLNQLKVGQLIRVEHANFQTLSIPPQSTAYKIQILR